MSVTRGDLDDFQRLASERLAGQGAESLGELLREREAARQRREVIDSVRRGLVDVDAGRTRPAQDALDDLRAGLARE